MAAYSAPAVSTANRVSQFVADSLQGFTSSAAAPTAGTSVTSVGVALAIGQYSIQIVTWIDGAGTPAAGDLNNMALAVDGTVVLLLPVAEANRIPMGVTVIFTTNGTVNPSFRILAVGNATASTVYCASMVLTQLR